MKAILFTLFAVIAGISAMAITTETVTTEQFTTEQFTTEQSATEQFTTEQFTTEQFTTEQSATEQSTTEQSTTEKMITEEPVVSVDASLDGVDPCTWGPTHWCSNLTNTAQCQATTYCIMKEWSQMTVEEDDDSVCDACKKMIEQSRVTREFNQTQEELIEILHSKCDSMIIQFAADQCKILIDQFLPQLIEIVRSKLAPTVICSVTGFCNSHLFDELISDIEEIVKVTEEEI